MIFDAKINIDDSAIDKLVYKNIDSLAKGLNFEDAYNNTIINNNYLIYANSRVVIDKDKFKEYIKNETDKVLIDLLKYKMSKISFDKLYSELTENNYEYNIDYKNWNVKISYLPYNINVKLVISLIDYNNKEKINHYYIEIKKSLDRVDDVIFKNYTSDNDSHIIYFLNDTIDVLSIYLPNEPLEVLLNLV